VIPFHRSPALPYAGLLAIAVLSQAALNGAPAPVPLVFRLVNAGSYTAGPIAPGEVVTLFGNAIGPANGVGFKPDAAGRVANNLGNTRVLFNGGFSPVLYASSTQVTVVVPAGLAPGSAVAVQVEYLGVASAPVIARVAAATPGFFTASETGRDQVLALNQDGSRNAPEAPASPGDTITLFLSGGGVTLPPSPDGVITGATPAAAAAQVTASVGNTPAAVLFAGAAPGFTSGIFQVRLRLPDTTPSSNHVFVSVHVGGTSSPAGSTIAVANGTTALPGSPDFLTASPSPAGVDLQWSAPDAGTLRVHIDRTDPDTGAYDEIAAIAGNATAWSDASVRASTAYYYRVHFELPAGYSEYSVDAGVTASDSYINPPQRVSAVPVSPSQVTLLWNGQSVPPGATGVIIERSAPGQAFAPIATLDPGASAYLDSSLSSSTDYSYRLRTVTPSGMSPGFSQVTVTTPDRLSLPDAAPRIHPADPHRLTIGGATWYISGYYPTLGALSTDQTDLTYYRPLLDTLASNGINYLRLVLDMGQPFGDAMPVYIRTGPGTAADGRPAVDLNQFNQPFFDYWRSVVQYAQSKGLVIQVCMLDEWHSTAMVVEDDGPRKVWGLQFDYFYAGNNVNGVNITSRDDLLNPANSVFAHQQALARKIVDTLGDLPNIVWEIGNESGQFAWELPLADYTTAYEQSRHVYQHLIVPRDLPGHQFVPGQCTNDPATAHTGLVRAFPQNLALITDNDCIGADTPDIRRGKAWAALTAGAQIDLFHAAITDPAVLASSDAAQGMIYIGLQQKFLSDLKIELAGMVPLDSDVSNGWAMGRSGVEYIAYLKSGGTTTVPALSNPSRAVWFNPRDGSSVDAGSGPQFRAPDKNDWVLYLLR
jgi:uncharacterized protein (TIGR03437 family)